jgi:superfamily II DNA or RNA helicase
MKLRSYQRRAVENVFAQWRDHDSTLIVCPTGAGKTIIFGHVIREAPSFGVRGRVMVVAHREELIWQAAQKIEAVTGKRPSIEMAEYRADHSLIQSNVVVASVQTLIAGGNGGRMKRFDPADFGLLVIDEFHHAVADTYRRVIDHFKNCKRLGVTATPDRADEAALGQVCESVAFDYEISDAIEDGWLAPVRQTVVEVDGLDLSNVRTTAGDLNGADLARVMEYEQNLHEIASPSIELCGDRRTLVFAASVAQAERLCEIFNRHRSECARFVCGETPKEIRRQMLAEYAQGRFQYLVNCAVATEGFDEPGIQVVVMARPTKSRSLYAQMAGRATRPLPGVVDSVPDNSLSRRQAIESSPKPFCEIIDFVGNSGRHKLITAADILGGKYPDEVVELAAQKAREAGRAIDMLDALKASEAEIHAERERLKAEEAARRSNVRVGAKYATRSSDPFSIFGLEPRRERGWDTGKQPSEKMLALLEKQGIDTEGMSYAEARQLITEITGRWEADKCSYKQAKLLARYGLPVDTSRHQANAWIDEISKNNWKLPQSLEAQLEPVEVF